METHKAIEFTDQDFGTDVKGFNGVVLVDFWAPWCGPCQMMSPRIEELAEKFTDNILVKIGKVDVDQNEQLAMEYQIMSIPSIKIFVKGEIVDEILGVANADVLEEKINSALERVKDGTEE